MRRRLRWAMVVVAASAAAILVVILLTSRPQEATGEKLVVPQGQGADLEVPKAPASSVSVLPPVEPPPDTSTSTSTPPPPPSSTRPPAPPSSPSNRTPLRSAGVDFQAENARVNGGAVKSDHAGFTGSGFVDYDNVSGSSVEWSVTARETTGADVVIRFANGSNESRPMNITVNGIQVASASFGPTDGWEDYRTVTVRVNLLAGTSRIKATAITDKGGPNVDKITVV